jgi:hypothetical protein
MKIKDVIRLTLEQVATQSDDVRGIQKVMSPIVRRKVPAGYIEDVRKKKKRKITIREEEQQDVDSYDSMTSKGRKGNSSYSNMGKTFDGTRPKYKQKTDFLFNKKKKKHRKVQEEIGMTQSAPYQDLEFLTKFWREGKGKANLENVDKDKKDWAGIKRKEKTSKNKKKKPQGTYQPDVQKDKDAYLGISAATPSAWSNQDKRAK